MMTQPLPASNDSTPSDVVVLLHGLGDTQASMAGLMSFLLGGGWRVVLAGYPSLTHPMETLHTFLASDIDRLPDVQRFHFVTHSLGGVVLRHYLALNPEFAQNRLGRVVMIAPPNQGSEFFDVYQRFWWFRLTHGPISRQLGRNGFVRQLPQRVGYDLGVIAATLPSDPLSWHVMQYPHDGRVNVDATKIDGMRDHLTLPLGHRGTLWSPSVACQVQHFLRHGEFVRLSFESNR